MKNVSTLEAEIINSTLGMVPSKVSAVMPSGARRSRVFQRSVSHPPAITPMMAPAVWAMPSQTPISVGESLKVRIASGAAQTLNTPEMHATSAVAVTLSTNVRSP